LEADGTWADIVFIDDNPDALAAVRFPAVRTGSIRDYHPGPHDRVAVTIGVPDTKRRVCELLASRGAAFVTLRHPSAIVGATSEIGEGCILCPGVVVTANAHIGRFVTLNVHSFRRTRRHRRRLLHAERSCRRDRRRNAGDWCVSRQSCGGGTGVRVGAFALIGAGSVALRAVEAGATVIGVPGRSVGRFSGPARRHSATGRSSGMIVTQRRDAW
jgi:acetyltransferase-like isoleucine patch superfamily enzyme